MNYTFEEAEKELDNLFDKLIAEAKTDKEKHSLRKTWSTYKQSKAATDDDINGAYSRGWDDGYLHCQNYYQD